MYSIQPMATITNHAISYVRCIVPNGVSTAENGQSVSRCGYGYGSTRHGTVIPNMFTL